MLPPCGSLGRGRGRGVARERPSLALPGPAAGPGFSEKGRLCSPDAVPASRLRQELIHLRLSHSSTLSDTEIGHQMLALGLRRSFIFILFKEAVSLQEYKGIKRALGCWLRW